MSKNDSVDVVAVNSEDPKEFYAFINFNTVAEALKYIKEKAYSFELRGGWTLEVRNMQNEKIA